jgi:hypothetical protein
VSSVDFINNSLYVVAMDPFFALGIVLWEKDGAMKKISCDSLISREK